MNPLRQSFQLSSVLLLTGALVLGAPLMASGSVKSPTTTSLLAAAKISIAKEKSVHVKVVAVAGKVDSTLVADIGSESGTETYVSGKKSFTISVTPQYAYLSGSLTGLTTLMGLTSAEQKKIGTSAMSMKKGTTEYTQFHTNMTSGSFVQLLPAVKGTTLLSQRDKATNGFQLKWSTTATSSRPKTTTVMIFSAGKATLPLSDKITTSASNSTTTFSKWGEVVQVSVPTSTISYSKVFAKK